METIQHNKTGILTDRNEKAFGTEVKNLLADPEKLEKFGLAGRESVLEKWTWKVSAETMENHFKAVINSSENS